MRGLLTLFSVLGLLALIGAGGYYAYGEGLGYLQATLADIEAQIQDEAEAQYFLAPNVDVTISEAYLSNSYNQVAFKVEVDAGIFGSETKYVTISIPDMATQESGTLDTSAYMDASFVLTEEPATVKGLAVTLASIAAAVWIGCWVLKVFVPKK